MARSGDDHLRSANDEFMDSWDGGGDQGTGEDYDDAEEPRRTSAPGLLPGMLIGAGLAALCAVGIYALAGREGDRSGSATQTVTYTQDGPTQTVTQAADSGDAPPASTVMVTQPARTTTVKVVQPGKDVTHTSTTTSTATVTTTGTTTVTSTPPAQTTTVTQTVTSTGPVGPTKPPQP